ncbi:hypothetical protein ACOMHN_044250 [Nucella lapillus]
MKRGHHEVNDTNRNHKASDLTVSAHHDNTTATSDPSQQLLYRHVSPDLKTSQDVLPHTSSAQHRHVSPDIKDVLPHTSSPQHPQTETGSSILEPAFLVPTQQPGLLSRPGQLFPSAGDIPTMSPGECSDSFCHLASSAVDSDSSSSPDINSNTLLVGFGVGDLRRREADDPTVAQTGDSPSSDEKMLKIGSGSKLGGEKVGDTVRQPVSPTQGAVSTTQGNQPSQQDDMTAPFDPAPLLEDISTTFDSVHCEDVENVSLGHQQSPLEGAPSHSALDIKGTSGSNKLSQNESTGLTGRLSGRTSLSPDVSFRHSVDMDVETEYTEDHVPVPDAVGIPPSLTPLTLLQAGPVGRGHPVSLSGQSSHTLPPHHQSSHTQVSHSLHIASAGPSLLVTEPLQNDQPADCGYLLEEDPSAVWTVLRDVDSPDSSMQQSSPQSDRSSPQTSLHALGSTVSPDSMSATVGPRDINNGESHVERQRTLISAESITRPRHSSSSILFGNVAHDGSQTTVLTNMQSQHSSQTLEINQNGGHIVYPGNGGGLGGQGVMEEEVVMYAHHLLSWGLETTLSGDRRELPDPVATLLTEGDHSVSHLSDLTVMTFF